MQKNNINHNQFLMKVKKIIRDRRIDMILLPFIGLVSCRFEWISKDIVFFVCMLKLLMISWYDPMDKMIFIAENICLEKWLNNLNSILFRTKIAVNIRRVFTVMFIQVGIACAEDNYANAKNGIIMFFIIYVIIDFIFYPLEKILKLIEDNINYDDQKCL